NRVVTTWLLPLVFDRPLRLLVVHDACADLSRSLSRTAVIHCKARAHGSRRYQRRQERTMHLPPTVSAALAVSGLVPLEAKLLLAQVLGRDRAWLAAHGDAALTPAQARAFD